MVFFLYTLLTVLCLGAALVCWILAFVSVSEMGSRAGCSSVLALLLAGAALVTAARWFDVASSSYTPFGPAERGGLAAEGG